MGEFNFTNGVNDLRPIVRARWQRWNRRLPILVLSLCGAGSGALAADPPGTAERARDAPAFHLFGPLSSLALPELSGLAASRTTDGRWWGLNDSGNPAELHAIGPGGRDDGRVAVAASNVDWEDLAGYELDGRAWLAIADTGDNFRLRDHATIWLLPEPALPAAGPAAATAIDFRWADGPRDCEAMAVDPAGRRILLADKGRRPAGLYELPLQPTAPGHYAVARRIADLPVLWPGPPPPVLSFGDQRNLGTPTAMDLSADGRRLLLLTYRHLVEFERRDGEDWSAAIARTSPRYWRIPEIPVAEAAAYTRQADAALIGGESPGGPLWRFEPPR